MASKLRARERVTLLVFVVVWAWCLVMRFLSFSHPAPRSAYVNAWPADGYPVVAGFFSDSAEERSQLSAGDRIVRVADHDLRGGGQMRFGFALSDAVSRAAGPVPIAVERAGQTITVYEPVPARPD